MSKHADPLLGTVLAGRYQIVDRLGGGAMGSIYRGRHLSLGRPVAIKVLAPELARDGALVQRFIREAQAAAAIANDNTVDIEDIDELPGGGAFFVMELLEGRDLAVALRRDGRFAWPRAREILVQIARALAAAHALGIVHRDMKPANVFLIERRGTPDFVKIIDFGIAKVQTEAKLTREGMVLGTAGYMAPEQVMSDEVDGRTDIYAVCCMLFELLAGRRPFVGDDYLKVLAAHIREPVPRLFEVAPDTDAPPEVEALLARGLAKLAEHRFADMLEFERALLAVPCVSTGSGQTFAPGHGAALEAAAVLATAWPSSDEVEATQILEQPPALLTDAFGSQQLAELGPQQLAALAYLFVAFAHGTDGVLSNAEMRTLADKLRAWAPSLGLARLGEILRRVVADYGALPSALKAEQTHHCAEQLGLALDDEQRTRVLDELRAIASADGRVLASEEQFIEYVTRGFARRRDPRLRACTVLYFVVGHVDDGVDPAERQVITEQLSQWVPDASLAETEEILRETVETLAQLPREADRLAYALRCADRLAASSEQPQLRRILADLWRIAGANGAISVDQQRFIMDVVDRFGTMTAAL